MPILFLSFSRICNICNPTVILVTCPVVNDLCRCVAQSVQIGCTKCAKALHKLCKGVALSVQEYRTTCTGTLRNLCTDSVLLLQEFSTLLNVVKSSCSDARFRDMEHFGGKEQHVSNNEK